MRQNPHDPKPEIDLSAFGPPPEVSRRLGVSVGGPPAADEALRPDDVLMPDGAAPGRVPGRPAKAGPEPAADLNELRRRLLATPDGAPVPGLMVKRDGTFSLDGEAVAGAQVTRETFASRLDLNELRGELDRAREAGRRHAEGFVVTREGNVRRGDAADGTAVSKVTAETFAGLFEPARLRHDRQVVARHLPPGTVERKVDGYEGWLVPITSDLGDAYWFYLYFNPSLGGYLAKCVEPRAEDLVADGHTAHYFQDGHVCIDRRNGPLVRLSEHGEPLRESFTRLALWALNFSIYRQSGTDELGGGAPSGR